jgi:hypothetical protein
MTQVIDAKVVNVLANQVTGWVHIVVGVVEAVLATLVAVKGLRGVPVPAVNIWARRHGVAIDNITGPYVERYLTRGRRIRTVCFLVPFALGVVLQLVAGLYGVRGHDSAVGDWAGLPVIVAVLGYVGGVVVAELTWRPDRGRAGEPQPATSGRPQAAMAVARDLSAYLPRWAMRLLRVAAAATVLVIPVIGVVNGHGGESLIGLVGSGLTAVVVTVVVELASRHVVGRRQAVMTPEWLAADDAVRATSAHALSGVGVLFVTLVLSSQLGQLVAEGTVSPSGAVASWVVALAVVTLVVGLCLWLQLMQPSWWPVRRFPVPA